jgi:hypothetical protein
LLPGRRLALVRLSIAEGYLGHGLLRQTPRRTRQVLRVLFFSFLLVCADPCGCFRKFITSLYSYHADVVPHQPNKGESESKIHTNYGNSYFEGKGVSSGNGILRTLRSAVSSWNRVRRYLMRNAKPPAQSSWPSSTGLPVKRAVIEFWSVLF